MGGQNVESQPVISQGPVATGGMSSANANLSAYYNTFEASQKAVSLMQRKVLDVLLNFDANNNINVHTPELKVVELFTLMRNVCGESQEENRSTIKTLSESVERLSADKRELQTEVKNLKNDLEQGMEPERQKLKEQKNSVQEKSRKIDELLKQFQDQQEEQERKEKSANEARRQVAHQMKDFSQTIDQLSKRVTNTMELYTTEMENHISTEEKFRKDIKAQKAAHAEQLSQRQEELNKWKNSQTGSIGYVGGSPKDLELRAKVRKWVAQCEEVESCADLLSTLENPTTDKPNKKTLQLVISTRKDLETATKSRQDYEIALREHYLHLVKVEGVGSASLEDASPDNFEGMSSATDVTGDSGYKTASLISGELIRCPSCKTAWNPRASV